MSIAFTGCNPTQRWANADEEDTPQLGTIGASAAGKLFVFVHASGSIAVNLTCQIRGDYEASTVTTANGEIGTPLGVATADFADNEYGWLQVWGQTTVRASATIADNANLGSSGTSGNLDDANNDHFGIIANQSRSGAGTLSANLHWPRVAA